MLCQIIKKCFAVGYEGLVIHMGKSYFYIKELQDK